MKFDGVDGESQSQGFENYNDILRYKLKEIFDIPTGRGSRGLPYAEVEVFMKSDRAFPLMFENLALFQNILRIDLVTTVIGPEAAVDFEQKIALLNAEVVNLQQFTNNEDGSLNKLTIRADKIEIISDGGRTKSTQTSWDYTTQ